MAGSIVPDTGLGLEALWSETLGHSSVCVAIVDGPVDLSHEALRGADLRQAVPDSRDVADGVALRHGTHVASVIFGRHPGPVPGIAPGCRGITLPLFADTETPGEPACSQPQLAAAIFSALDEGAHVVNISASQVFPGSVHAALADAIDACAASGTLVIAAAGEHGCYQPGVPGALESVLAVATTGAPGVRTAPGGSPKTTCLLAPGSDILGALAGGGVVRASGTSYATAVASGVAALLLSLQASSGVDLDPLEVGRILVAAARPTPLGRMLDPAGAARTLKQRMAAGGNGWEQRATEAHRLTAVLDAMECQPAEHALTRKFHGVRARDFGTVTVRLSRSSSYRVVDFRYPGDDGRLGMRFVPVSDEESLDLPDGASVAGSALLDAHLRREMRLGDAAPLYALLSYIHPEHHAYDAAALPHTAKVQLGYRHVGAYLGGGRTTHALSQSQRWRGDGPARMRLNADRHPANVHVISLDGVEQETLNRNAAIIDEIVATLARVPKDADNITDCRTLDLTTTLQYYRDLLRSAEYLEELPWFTQCTVHKAIVVNVALNVPHNPTAFGEIFGRDGDEVWRAFQRQYEAVRGQPFTEACETAFTPLWERAGLTAGEIAPLSLGEYHAYHAARDEDRLESHPGRAPLSHGVGLAWPLETLAGLLTCFIDTYTPFELAGGIVVAGEALLLGSVLRERLGIDEWTYMEAVAPVVGKVLAAEATTKGTLAPAWLAGADRELYWFVRRGWRHPQRDDPKLRSAIDSCLRAAHGDLAALRASIPADRRSAAAWLRAALGPELTRLSAFAAPPGGRTGYFWGPAVFHRLALGLHPKNSLVTVRTVGTIMDRGDLTVRPRAEPAEHGPDVRARIPTSLNTR